MGTMGDSTRRRMSAAIGAGGGLGGTRSGFNPGTSVGGYAGGMGGTFGKAARGLASDQAGPSAGAGYPSTAGGASGGPPARPASAGRIRPSDGGGGPSARDPIPRYYEAGDSYRAAPEVRRERARPASASHTVAWDKPRELPRAPPPGTTTGKVARPKSATAPKPWGREGVEQVEYKLLGKGLEGMKVGSGSGARPTSSGGVHGTPPSAGGERRSSAPGSKLHYNVPGDSVQQLRQLRAVEDQDGPGERAADQLTEAHLMTLEDAIRDAVRQRRSVYEGSKEMLMKLFKAVDDGSGDVSIDEFIAVCEQVGVQVSTSEAQALFRRYGYDTVMPYERFAHTLLTQPSRQLAEEMPVRKGAFQAGQHANFHGKILYRPCRKPVYTPSDWNPALAERSAELPDARLILDFVYGYQGKDNTQQNLFYTAENKVIYYTAGVGIVYQRPPVHHQYFFLGHTDDVSAIALCPAQVELEGRQYPAKTLVATGQVTSTTVGAYICIWDSRTGTQPDGPAAASEITRLEFDKDARGFCALAFSPSGNRLVAVALDNYHTVYIYDWRKKRELSSGRGQMGDPPQVYGIEWNPHEPSTFVQFGKKHIKVWSSPDDKAWSSKSLSFGRLPMQNVTSAQWLPPRGGAGSECLLVAGTGDGQLYVFKGGVAVKAIAAHRPGIKVIQADGHPAYSGVRGMRVIKGGKVLISGGADGSILQWDTSDGSIQESRYAGGSIQLRSPFGPGDKNLPCIRAIDYSEDLGKILVGTNNCDVLEVTETTDETLMDGHAGDIYYVAFHPAKPSVFATVSDSGHVHLWDGAIRQMTHCAALGWDPRTVAFSQRPVTGDDGYHLAVGSARGQIKILDEGANLRPLHECKDSKEGVAALSYSPNNRFMASATYDTWIDIYSVEKGYQRVARCSGHSSTVRGIDWSMDSSMVMSNSNDYELLFWNARTGKQITLPQRDVDFYSYTCMLGFPVMGIWPADANGLDLNALDRAHSGKWVVTSDDQGMVKLFNYPCVVDDAPHRAYRGHSSHVMCVRFNSNDTTVCSVGGHDWAVFQFRVVELRPQDAPPPAAEPVWGPLDDTGRTFGYTTRPVRPVHQHPPAALPGPAHAHMPAITEEASGSNVGGPARSQRPPLPPGRPSYPGREQQQQREEEEEAVAEDEDAYHGYDDVDDDLAENPAPMRMGDSGDDFGAQGRR